MPASGGGRAISVLYVDDELDFADMAAEFLEREDDRFEVETATSASEGLEYLDANEVDCVVSDYGMPGRNGIAFLEAVREDHPDLPFLLYTGKGSEEVAADAISAGVTDYLQKETGTDQYVVLANRITNAVESHRSQRALAERNRKLRQYEHMVDAMREGACIYDEEGRFEVVNEHLAEWYDTTPDALEGRHSELIAHLRERADDEDPYQALLDGRREQVRGEFTGEFPGHEEATIEYRLVPLRVDGTVEGVVGVSRDVTEREKHKRKLQRKERRFEAVFEDPNILAGLLASDGTVLGVNRTAMEYVDAADEDVTGEPIWETPWWSEEIRPRLCELVERAADGEYVDYEADLTTPENDPYSVAGAIRPVTDDADNVVSLIISARDITDQSKREQAIEELHSTASAFMGAETAEEVADIAVEAVHDILDMPANGVHLYDDDEVELVPVAWTERTEELVGVPPTFAPGEGIAWTAFETGEMQLYDDIATVSERYNQDTVVRSQIAHPLADHGVLLLGSPEPGRFDETDVDLVRTLATHATTALDRIERERTLREYETLVETVGDPMYLLDERGYIRMANNAAVACLDADEETIVGTHISDITTDGDYERGAELVEELLDEPDREWATHEITAVTASGDRVPAEMNIGVLTDNDGEFTGSVGVMRDIRKRKNREQAIERLHETARALMEADTDERIAELAVDAARDVLDFPLSSIHLADQSGTRLTPVAFTDPVAEVIGDPPPEMTSGGGIAWEVFETGDAQWYDDVSTAPGRLNEEPAVRSEIILPLKDHGVFIVSSPEVGAFGEVTVSLAEILAAHTETALDRVEHERELKRQNERLDQFASAVSHDLRNPLNVAQGRLELAREECDSDHLGDVARAHDRMDTLITDLLTLAQEGEHVDEIGSVALADASEECWRHVETGTATLVVETDQTIRADPSRLKQLLENLIRNAVEHGGEDVTVTVGALDDGSGFYVADDGPGISPDQREAVFDAGHSTTEEGTGFGLAIVRQIVDAHDWAIRATEADGGGARFEIRDVETAE